MTSFDTLQKLGGPQAVKETQGLIIPESGWHFSYMGGAQRVVNKLHSYAHQEYNTAEFTDPNHIARALQDRTDLFCRPMEYGPSDSSHLPEYLRENRGRFSDWYCQGPFFREAWYSDDQCEALCKAYKRVEHLEGDIIEIGCWEGRSTVALANACFPEAILAVDTWQGSVDESPKHVSVQILRERDVFRDFIRNIRAMTAGNVRPIVAHSREFFARHADPIKFCHIDGSHDYESVRSDIQGALAWLIPGGMLCGDDYASEAPGVVRAVQDALPGYEHTGRFWHWRHP